MLQQVATQLKQIGIVRVKNSFYLLKDNNWGVIEFQKAREGLKDTPRFTVNLAISSSSIRGFFGDNTVGKPDERDWHWRERLGFLLPIKSDHWWTIDNAAALKEFSKQLVADIMKYGIPEIERCISDSSLLKEWLQGNSPGLTQYDRNWNLAILAKVTNSELLPRIIEDLKKDAAGKPYESTVKRLVSMFGLNY